MRFGDNDLETNNFLSFVTPVNRDYSYGLVIWKGRVEAVWETWVGRTTVLESKDDFFRECPEVPFFQAFAEKLQILSNVRWKRFVFDHMTLIT